MSNHKVQYVDRVLEAAIKFNKKLCSDDRNGLLLTNEAIQNVEYIVVKVQEKAAKAEDDVNRYVTR